MSNLFGNRGEWSEIYVFLYLLSIGKLFAADANLCKKDNTFYNILRVIRDEESGRIEFIFNSKNGLITIINSSTRKKLTTVDSVVFKDEAKRLYDAIVKSKGSSFSIIDTEEFLKKIYIRRLKAKSSDKSDIKMKIHDISTGFEMIQGFSIKSRLGKPSTLINAGRTTNFIYEVVGEIDDNILNEFNQSSLTLKEKLNFLKEKNIFLEYVDMENQVFRNNLVLIDSDLPAITASLLLEYYINGHRNIQDAISVLMEKNPLGYNISNGHPFYSYKFKKLLTECALGLLPSKVWDGTVDATGGYIIVREDGEVLCYHLFNRNAFEEYLLSNTRFETASTTRHEFGSIYIHQERYYIKLNLQVRFIK